MRGQTSSGDGNVRGNQLIIAIVSVFLVELLVMFLIDDVLPQMSPLATNFIDATLLVVLLLPILYYLHLRPLQQLRQEEQLRAEETMRELSTAMEQTADSVVITDKGGCIEYVNSAFERMTGYSRTEAIGMKPSVLKSGKHDNAFYDKLWATILSGNDFRETFTNRKKEGTLYFEMKTITPVKNGNGEITHFVSTGKDITANMKLENELMKLDRLESIGLLAGGIAHDFNNILTALLGNISVAKMSIDPDDQSFKLLGEAEKACMRARDLTQQLLTFSKGGAPVKRTTSVANLVKESATFALRGSNIGCQFAISDDLWPTEIDENQISQVVGNIVINAQQAMPKGGSIAVKCVNCNVGRELHLPIQYGQYVKISITDTGVGIPHEYIDKIFDPYFTTKQKGSGIGLATSHSIIRNHSGYIGVESEVGKGSIFSIYLPATPDAPIAERRDTYRVVRGSGKVLVMDDEFVIREVATAMLHSIGYDVDCAREGAEALELYKEAHDAGQTYSAVIMDLTISGGMGGKEAIKQLLEIDGNAKVIVSSGYSNDPIMANFKEYGFKGAVAKPYKIEEMSTTLAGVIKGA